MKLTAPRPEHGRIVYRFQPSRLSAPGFRTVPNGTRLRLVGRAVPARRASGLSLCLCLFVNLMAVGLAVPASLTLLLNSHEFRYFRVSINNRNSIACDPGISRALSVNVPVPFFN